MKEFTDAGFTPADILYFKESDTHTAFINGTSVFARNWPYQYGLILGGGDDVNITAEQTGVAPLPNGGTVGGWLLAINKNSENKDVAWEFMKFVTGPEGQNISAAVGGKLPGLNALLDSSSIKARNPMLGFEGFKNIVSTTIARPVAAGYTITSDAIQMHVHSYLSGSQDLDTTVKGVEDAMK
jgi:multiple sugar transport system substrate-binding protein